MHSGLRLGPLHAAAGLRGATGDLTRASAVDVLGAPLRDGAPREQLRVGVLHGQLFAHPGLYARGARDGARIHGSSRVHPTDLWQPLRVLPLAEARL